MRFFGAVVVAVAIAACGSSKSSSSSGTPAATATTGSSSSTPSGKTAPGTKLSVGSSARVDYTLLGGTSQGKKTTLLVTVTSIEKGTLDDFKNVQLDATEKASTPFYVKVHVTNLGPYPVTVDSSAAAIEGVDDTGNTQQSVTFIGDFPRCPDAASSAPLGTGKGYDDCLTFLVPGGITKVAYSGGSDYIDSPVTWSTG
jgi:hypothetical protein